MGETSEAITMTRAAVSGGYLEKSSMTFGAIFTSWKSTIHKPARDMIDSTPATRAQVNTAPGTRLARKSRWRVSEVLCGHPLPSRYCQKSHRTIAITGTHQGIAGLVLRFPTRSAPQTPWPTAKMTNARNPDHNTARI